MADEQGGDPVEENPKREWAWFVGRIVGGAEHVAFEVFLGEFEADAVLDEPNLKIRHLTLLFPELDDQKKPSVRPVPFFLTAVGFILEPIILHREDLSIVGNAHPHFVEKIEAFYHPKLVLVPTPAEKAALNNDGSEFRKLKR